MASSVSDFVRLSKSEIHIRPRVPAVSVLGLLMITVVSADVVDGGDFRTCSLVETFRGVLTG